MKKIVYIHPATQTVAVCTPREAARLAHSVTVGEITIDLGEASQPIEHFLGRWPVPNAVVEWAETEDQFVDRIAGLDITVTLNEPFYYPNDPNTLIPYMAKSEAVARNLQHTTPAHVILLSEDLPQDKSARNAWKLENGQVIIDGNLLSQIRPANVPTKELLAQKERRRQEILDTIGKGNTTERLSAIEAFLKEV